MRRFVLASLALALGLGIVGDAGASTAPKADRKGGHGDHDSRGRDYRKWTSCYFDHNFGCYLYRCSKNGSYYYWCARDNWYYPIDYCPSGSYACGGGCMCPGCPVMVPTHPPVCSTGGFKNTIHPIPGSPAPTPVTGNPTPKPIIGKLPPVIFDPPVTNPTPKPIIGKLPPVVFNPPPTNPTPAPVIETVKPVRGTTVAALDTHAANNASSQSNRGGEAHHRK
jgi:hypothetical protein